MRQSLGRRTRTLYSRALHIVPLIKCPDCTGAVSSQATTCPHCGCVLTMSCPHCGNQITAPPAPGPLADRWFADEVPPEYALINKKHLLIRRALGEAAKDRGTLREPRQRLKRFWEDQRARMKKSVPKAALLEYDSLTQEERAERQAEDAWEHAAARQLHMAMNQLKVRASEANAIIDMWFRHPGFDRYVQEFLENRCAAEELLRTAREYQRQGSRRDAQTSDGAA